MKKLTLLLLSLLLIIAYSSPSLAQIYINPQTQQTTYSPYQYNTYQNQQQYNPYQQQYNPYQQQYNPYQQQYNTQSPEALLQMQDQYAVQTLYMRSGQMDYRYGGFLQKISDRFNRAGSTIFPNYNVKNVQYIVLPGVFGFNAVAFHRSIIIDSIQMDGFRMISQGAAYYGKILTPYTDSVLKKINSLSQAINSGQRPPADYSNLNNPFGLPELNVQFTPAQQQKAMTMFEELVAANLAHEGAHTFREHNKNKLLTQQSLWLKYGRNNQNPQLLSQQIQSYLQSTYSKELEFEADTYGVMLLKASGYPLNGFINWMIIAERYENIMGIYGDFQGRTHPTCPARIQNARNAWSRL